LRALGAMADAAAAAAAEAEADEDKKAEASMRAALDAKGYDLVGAVESDSDEDLMSIMSGRIPTLEPGLAREKGKKAFQDGKYDKAIKYWQGGLKSILSSLCSGPQALADMNLSELDLTLNLNIAMAYMKKGDFEAADRSVEKALARRDALPDHLITKALYRKASAQRAMHRLEECLATLKDLLGVEAGNAAALQMQQEVDREWGKQCRQQRQNIKKMFDKLSGEDRKEEETRKQERADLRSRSGVVWVEGEDVDSAAFEFGLAPGCDGKDWGLALSRTVLWAMEELSVEGSPCLAADADSATVWFLGASSTCELRWLQPASLLARLPKVKSLELALIGFLGELNPENKREPDPREASLPLGAKTSRLPSDEARQMTLRVVKGTLQDALEKELKLEPEAPSSDDEPTEDEPPLAAAPPQVPPSICLIAHPQLHRYFSDFFPAISWLIQHEVPTVIIGPSEPDPSWKQDEVLLRAMGCNIVVSKRQSPYPMCLPDNPDVRKCSHIIGFKGGKVIEKAKLVRAKLDLLAQDYNVR